MSKWIKCSEQMPEDDTLCLGFDTDGVVWTAHFDSGVMSADLGNNLVIFTHWMPLPELPK